VFSRGNSPFWWIAYYRNGKEVRESTELTKTEKNHKKAEGYLKLRIGELAAERHGGHAFVGPAQRRITVNQLLDALEEDYKARDKCSPQFLSHLKRVRDAFGFWRAINLTGEPEAVDKYINLCKEAGMAPASINRGTQLLAQAFKLSIERRRLNAAPTIRHLPESNARQGFFEDADFKNVVAALPSYLKDFTRFAYLVGWRKGEIASLLWSDVDADVVRLRPALEEWRWSNRSPTRWRFQPHRYRRGYRTPAGRENCRDCERSANGGLRISPKRFPVGDLRKAWATACAAAGHDGMLFHDLRRTAVRNMVRAGVSEHVAMQISGHRTRSIFDRYNIVNERDKQEALQRTQDYLGSASKRRQVAVMGKRQESR
jgi:integrase